MRHPEDFKLMNTELMQQFFGNPNHEYWIDYRITNKTGKYCWCKYTGSLIVGKDGLPKYFLCGMIPHERQT
jgi:hypothetical protein